MQNSMRITVRVIPRSSRNAIKWEQGVLKVWLTAPPVDREANDALIALLAKRLDLPKSSMGVVHGAASRQKIVKITGMTVAEVTAGLQHNQK